MKSKIDFVNEKTGRSLIRMTMPLLMAMFLTMAYNLVDSLWVGNLLGENGYAALTDSTALILILNAIAMGAGNGVSILVAQLVGADNTKKTEGVIATVVFISSCFAVGLTAMAEIFLPGILKMLKTPAEIRNDAYAYLSIYLLGYTAIYLYMQFTSVFRAFGDPIFQMKGMFFTTVFNAVIDPILIKRMGLTGAAWATVLSEVLCLVYAIWYYKRKKLFTMDFHGMKAAYGKELLKDVVPSALQQCMPAISSAVMLTLVSSFGVTTIAAYGVTSKLEVLLFYPAMAVNMALVTIVGQCVGAGRRDRVKDYMKCACLYGSIFTGITSLFVIIFAEQLSWMFVRESAAAGIVKNFFCIVSVGYVCYMLTSCFLGQISGQGKPGFSMLLFFIYYIVVRIPLAMILVHTLLELNGIWTAILISHILAAALAFLIAYRNLRTAKLETIE